VQSTIAVTKIPISTETMNNIRRVFIFFTLLLVVGDLAGFVIRFAFDNYRGLALSILVFIPFMFFCIGTLTWSVLKVCQFYFIVASLICVVESLVKFLLFAQLRSHVGRMSSTASLLDRQFDHLQSLVNEFSRTALALDIVALLIVAVQISAVLTIHQVSLTQPSYFANYNCTYSTIDYFSMLKTCLVVAMSYFSRIKPFKPTSASVASTDEENTPITASIRLKTQDGFPAYNPPILARS
jgi:hypothetical protein